MDHCDGHQPGHDHPHDHSHDHPHDHSHDPAALLNDVVATTRDGIRAVKIGLLGLLATALIQLALVTLTGSVALLSDTVHNLGDCLTAFPIWLAFSLARRPATHRFTYGLGRVEDLSAVLVVAAIGASGVYAVAVSVDRLLHPMPVDLPWVVVGAGLVGMIGNELVARYRIRAGRRIGSLALEADGHHARTDGLTSAAVVGSGLATLAGWSWADPIVGLIIAGLIAALFVRTAKPVTARLLDAVDPELTRSLYAAAAAVPGVGEVRAVRVRWLGHQGRAEVVVTADPTLTVAAAHEVADAVEDAVRSAAAHVRIVTVSVEPDGPHHN